MSIRCYLAIAADLMARDGIAPLMFDEEWEVRVERPMPKVEQTIVTVLQLTDGRVLKQTTYLFDYDVLKPA
jgi:hypothetical protein